MRAFVVSLLACALCGCADDSGPDDTGPYVYVDQLEPSDELASVRFNHAATSLDDGRVMLVGGLRGAPSQLDFDAFVTEIELFDPVSETFEQGATLEQGRTGSTATRVADGRVVVLGGTTLDPNTLSIPALAIEVWSPETELFSTVGQLPASGALFHCAPAIADAVLVITRCYPGDCTPLSVDPSGDVTELGGDPSYTYLVDVDCAPLPDGRVLLAGGVETIDLVDSPAEYAEIYDPESETFELVGPLTATHGPNVELVTLESGDVFMFGDANDPTTLGHLYSSATGSLTAVTGAIDDRVEHSLTLLGDGRVLIAGGRVAETFELVSGLAQFDPLAPAGTGLTTITGASFEPRFSHAAVRLATGPVLIAGGQDSVGPRADALLFR